jgi:hypothetical protein
MGKVSERLHEFTANREFHPQNWYSRQIKQQIESDALKPNTTHGQLWSQFFEIIHSDDTVAKRRLHAGLKSLSAAA